MPPKILLNFKSVIPTGDLALFRRHTGTLVGKFARITDPKFRGIWSRQRQKLPTSPKIPSIFYSVGKHFGQNGCQGRALYGPIPVKTETFRELWAPLVHTFSWGNSYGPMVLEVLLKFPPTLVLVHGWLFPVCAYFSARRRTVCTNCSEIVCTNCVFIWAGGFVGGWVSPIMSTTEQKIIT